MMYECFLGLYEVTSFCWWKAYGYGVFCHSQANSADIGHLKKGGGPGETRIRKWGKIPEARVNIPGNLSLTALLLLLAFVSIARKRFLRQPSPSSLRDKWLARRQFEGIPAWLFHALGAAVFDQHCRRGLSEKQLFLDAFFFCWAKRTQPHAWQLLKNRLRFCFSLKIVSRWQHKGLCCLLCRCLSEFSCGESSTHPKKSFSTWPCWFSHELMCFRLPDKCKGSDLLRALLILVNSNEWRLTTSRDFNRTLPPLTSFCKRRSPRKHLLLQASSTNFLVSELFSHCRSRK